MANFSALWIGYCGECSPQSLHHIWILSCGKDAMVTILHVIFQLLFWSNLAVKWPKQANLNVKSKYYRNFNLVFFLVIVLLGAIHLGLGIWLLIDNLSAGSSLIPLHQWLLHMVRGLTWFTIGFTVSLRPRLVIQKGFMFIRGWWIIVFLIGNLDGLWEAMSLITCKEFSNVNILSLSSWPVCFCILILALKNDKENPHVNDVSQALLTPSLDTEERSHLNKGSQKTSRIDRGFANSGIFSKLTFLWLNPLLTKGREKLIDEYDLPPLALEDQAEKNYLNYLNKVNASTNPSILRILVSNSLKGLAITGIFALVKTCTMSCGPLVLDVFISFSEGKQAFKYEGYVLAGLLFILKVVESIAQRQWYFGARRTGLQVRSVIIAAIYQKQLKLSPKAKHIHTAGEINNYVAIDAYRVGEFPFWIHQIWTTLLQIIFSLTILYLTISWATFSVLFVVILIVVCNSPLAKLQHKFQSELMRSQDKRLRATTEILSHIKILKLHAWERYFKKKVENLREVEYKWLSSVQFLRAYSTLLFWSAPVFVSTVAFATCYVVGIPLTPSNVFTFIATQRLLQRAIRAIPDLIVVVIQAKVSLDRIEAFLGASELQKDAVQHNFSQNPNCSVSIESSTLSWDTKSLKPTLRNVNMEVKPGQKVAICGEVGSGKSTLLAAILGEVPKMKGQINVWGSVAYVSQSAWIQSGTIQENILFGSPMNSENYQDVIMKCSLVKDLQSFPFGDQTGIGERGVNLSGGQKQRIQLARALYQDADIYLLDDPFSAVDADTASSLFKDYIIEALSKKTVILSTHQVDFLPTFDVIMLMEDGKIVKAGGYQELLASSKKFNELVNANKDSIAPNGDTSTLKKEPRNYGKEIQECKSKRQESTHEEDQLIKKEEKEIGDTGIRPYKDYLEHNKGYFYCILGVITHIVFFLSTLSQHTWMAAMVQNPQVSSLMLIGVYSGIGFVGVIFLFFRTALFVYLGLGASRTLFSGLMTSLIQAPMAFYDTTPLGRVISRVSSDLNILDVDLPYSLSITVASTLNNCGTIVVIAVFTWQALVVILPMVYFVFQLQKYYFSTAKELMRINGTTKSPIANHLGESIAGATTIRAFKMEDRFVKKHFDIIDRNASPLFHTFSANEWLIQRLELLSAIVLCSSALTLVLLPNGTFKAGFVGLALSYGLSLNITLVSSVQNQCTLTNYIVSVERIKQYMHTPSEAPEVIEDNRPPTDWPSNGKVELQELKIRYRSKSPLVLRGVTCTFEARHKIGVVGRTGSGKSTLIGALFRLVEPAGGRILIDGLDITSIGLHDLRSHLGIIPQDPTLFRGSVRFNLDPLSEYSDLAIWDAMNKCQLGDIIKDKEGGLDSLVSDDGENWSVGQRQLFCLGRALLKRSRILVLDEATASIDNATDTIIQTTIRKEFGDCTVITVAHRIPTIMGSDMVLSISDGELMEYDEPLKLVGRGGSLFAKLVSEYLSHSLNALVCY